MLKRLKPDPIPTINPVPEFVVAGRTKELYDDTKLVLQVPWMGVVTMALAHYLTFYEALWKASAPVMASQEAIAACARLRAMTEDDVAKLNPPKRGDTLGKMGYAPREIENIKQSLEVFSHGNFLYAMMATQSRLALELGKMPPPSAATPFVGRHAPGVDVPFVLMEAHHADDQTRDVYASIRNTLGLPFVNTDYRALARWPTYFRMAWSDLAGSVETPNYNKIVEDLHDAFASEAIRLPNPTGTTAAMLQEAASQSASLEEVLAVNQLFHWLLPGLITNVAYFRAQLV